MGNTNRTHLHPVEKAGTLEGYLRRSLQNPKKIIGKYVQSKMTVLDLGCGTGYFTTEIAKLLNNPGKVIAADVQEGMLNILRQKLAGNEIRHKIQIHFCQENCLGLKEKVDFILAFYSFHEMQFIDSLIPEIRSIMKPETKILIVEQKFHVPKYTFNSLIQKMKDNGFSICERPRIFLSRAVVMKMEP